MEDAIEHAIEVVGESPIGQFVEETETSVLAARA